MTETPAQHEYRLLREFRRLFEGRIYKHRASNQGDFVAMHLYEDLIEINRSTKLREGTINRRDRVLNVQNKRRGVEARRGDGTFGEIIPGETALSDPGYLVGRGPIATVEIGIEVKVLAKAMIAGMKSGEVVEEGETSAVLSAPRHPYTRTLLDAVPAFLR